MGGGEDDALEGILARRTGAFGGACVGLFLFYKFDVLERDAFSFDIPDLLCDI